MRKSRAKKRKSQPDDSDQETEEARPTKKARPSASKKQKEKAEEADVPIPGAEDAKPPQKTISEPKPMSTAGSKKKEPASPPKTPVNKKKPGKPHKKKPDSDEESEDGKRASTPPVLKVRLNVMVLYSRRVLTTFYGRMALEPRTKALRALQTERRLLQKRQRCVNHVRILAPGPDMTSLVE